MAKEDGNMSVELTSFEQACDQLADHFAMEREEVRSRVKTALRMTGDGSNDRWEVRVHTEQIAHLIKLTGNYKGPREFELNEEGKQWDKVSGQMVPIRTIVHNRVPRMSARRVHHSHISPRNKA